MKFCMIKRLKTGCVLLFLVSFFSCDFESRLKSNAILVCDWDSKSKDFTHVNFHHVCAFTTITIIPMTDDFLVCCGNNNVFKLKKLCNFMDLHPLNSSKYIGEKDIDCSNFKL